ncbi:MAG: hypothetical protein RLZZ630_797 [Bacteroidota bacterium]|jgi:hypothetical protein
MKTHYKYLHYIPKPIDLAHSAYDLVDDEEFCTRDERIPLLMLTQFGIFPTAGAYGKRDYGQLHHLEGQMVGFIGRGYLSNRERKGIRMLLLTSETIQKVYNNEIVLDLKLWENGI